MQVRNIQTPTLFGDCRIPKDRPRFAEAKSLADLTDKQLQTLYTQEGHSIPTTVFCPGFPSAVFSSDRITRVTKVFNFTVSLPTQLRSTSRMYSRVPTRSGPPVAPECL